MRNDYKNSEAGFTLAELLIVIAIIGVLVAISIPIFSSQLHKAKVAADLANLRSFYAELQADYIETDRENKKIMDDYGLSEEKHTSYIDLYGNTIKLQDGYFAVTFQKKIGYQISYYCNDLSHYGNAGCTSVIG